MKIILRPLPQHVHSTMRNPYRFTSPPTSRRRPHIQCDNFALVTANLMPFMDEYRALCDRQPRGTAVLVLPASASPLRRVYAAVARVLRENGRNVKLYSVV